MKSLYKEKQAQEYIAKYPWIPPELALRIYTSHLIGQDTDLVLHGGGNTSVKSRIKNILGEELDVLYVKGSGWDLSNIEPQGFPALDLVYLKKLRDLSSLTDEEMVNQLRTHMMDSSSPDPSVEALLHAFLPHRFIDHTHADAILILTNQPEPEKKIREALGDSIAILPYIMPGFPLAKAVAEAYEKNPGAEAMVLIKHGLFTFANDAKTSYEKTIEYVDRAEKYIHKMVGSKSLVHATQKTVSLDISKTARVCQVIRGALAHRNEADRLCRCVLEVRNTPDLIEASQSKEALDLCSTGVLTPDHIIRTKNNAVWIDSIPEQDASLREYVHSKIEGFKAQYDKYFEAHTKLKGLQGKKRRLDPYPRVFLVAGVGMISAGLTRKEALIAADIAEHTLRAKLKAFAMGKYQSLPETDLFDMEYWVLEQKKLGQSRPLPLQGQVALITGGAGAIAFGVAEKLLSSGAIVVLTDISLDRLEKAKTKLAQKYGKLQVETLKMDVTNLKSVQETFEKISLKLGGIDIVVPNAGIAHVEELEHLSQESLQKVMDVNFTGVFTTIKVAADLFRRQGTGGNIIVNSSKNVFAPSESFGAYSVSKAAAHQLSKIAAMELSKISVRVNMINADAIFGNEEIPSGLWQEIGPERMKARGLSADELKNYYRDRNLLKTEVLAEHVGNAVVFFATEQTPTTGSTLPVDGGIPAAFPR
ncbi:MAG: bifunctional aldolase/short-chain dehydrogenase [Deltaproteobacteria bacterium]|nr:bifunctional aldolase/short-chain dehydrogenase [Deltaproteobacteria bacterium]